VAVIGFLHTADVHVPTFRGLLAELGPQHRDVHVVDAGLLATARRDGITAAVTAGLAEKMRELSAAGARVVVCTCSTLGEQAELLAAGAGATVLRADRPMAEAAVAAGPRIAVVAAVESTLEPTLGLLRSTAERTATEITLTGAPCPAAWELFLAGDLDGYARAIAAHTRAIATGADVVVLAQASMAPAAALLTDLAIPVLTSPRTAVAEAVRRAG
jgi:aspartate/glutamate racemase